jgi:hypothetical protein
MIHRPLGGPPDISMVRVNPAIRIQEDTSGDNTSILNAGITGR